LVRRLARSEPRLLVRRGEFLDTALVDERLSRNEVLSAVRNSGCGSLQKVDAVILETDGSISVVPSAAEAQNAALEVGQTFVNSKIVGFRNVPSVRHLPYLQKIGRPINRRLLDVERVSQNSGLSGNSIQRVVQPTVTGDGEKAPGIEVRSAAGYGTVSLCPCSSI
jgi:hypothetical protein